jgi:hypothetical protein
MKVTPMDPTGKFKIDIDQAMMAPDGKLDQSVYNGGIDVGVISESDGSVFAGKFGDKDDKKRRLEGTANYDDDAGRMSFKPLVADHDEFGILVHLEFDNPETVSVMGEGTVDLKFKELSVFKTKETMRSLTADAF